MQKVKSSISIICVLLFLLAAPLTAYADVVWGNEFQSRNHEDTIWVRRSFYVNSADGYLISRAAPGARIDRSGDTRWDGGEGGRRYENGHVIPISSAYRHRGNYWGLIHPGGHSGPCGWVPMPELLMRYDASDFVAEHESEFYGCNDTIDVSILLEFESFIIWRWPGSDREKYTFSDLAFDRDPGDFWRTSAIEDVYVDFAYRDSEGREWVHVTISGGWPSGGLDSMVGAAGWVCLSEPDNIDIPMFNPAAEPILWSPTESPDWWQSTSAQQEIHEPRQPDDDDEVNGWEVIGQSEEEFTDSTFSAFVNNHSTTIIVIALTISLIAGTVVLILVIRNFGKRKRK